jgi:hypothetical protein
MIAEWATFLSTRGYNEDDDYTLSTFLRTSRLKLVVLFVVHLEEDGKTEQEVTTHLRALRFHFLHHCADSQIFDDPAISVLRKSAMSGRDASFNKEKHLRLPTPSVFIPWLRDTYYVPGLATGNAEMMMVYIGNACAYDKGMRCSEYAHSTANEEGEHAIRVEDVYFEAHSSTDILQRFLPFEFSKYAQLPCCSVVEAKASHLLNRLRGSPKYYAVRAGHRRGVFACIHEWRAALKDFPGLPEGAAFTSRAAAAAYCIREDLDRRPPIDCSRIVRIHMLLRSAKNSRDGTVRRLVFQRSFGEDGSIQTDAESTLVGDIIEFAKSADFSEADSNLQFLSRRKDLRVLKLNRFHVTQSLKDAAVHFGLDPEFFSTHCHRIAAASSLSQAGYGDEDIRRFIGWVGKSSQLYERDFQLRPSTLRLLEQGYSISLTDTASMVPPRAFAKTKSSNPQAPRKRAITDATVHAKAAEPVTTISKFGRPQSLSRARREADLTQVLFTSARATARRHSAGGGGGRQSSR